MIGIQSRRTAALLGTLLLTLAITGGLFAYAYTTETATITAQEYVTDYADVSANETINYSFHGRERGKIPGGVLFDVERPSTYTGDLEVNVYISNVDELQKDYSFWMLRLELTDADNTTTKDMESSTQVLSLDSPFVTFIGNDWTVPCYVRVQGGSYRAFPSVHGLGGFDPLLYCQVNQVGP